MNLREAIGRITGLVYCGNDCPCGRRNRLWYTDVKTPEEWLSLNGIPTDEVVEEIRQRIAESRRSFLLGVQEGRAAQAIEELRGRDKFIADCQAKGIKP